MTLEKYKVKAKAVKHGIGNRVAKRYELQELGGYVNACLSKGKSSGNVTFRSGNGTKFVCTYNCIGGRGLRVVEDVERNKVIAQGYGKLMSVDNAKDVEAFKVYDSKEKLLVLDAPTKDYPANLANTSDGTLPNNCKLIHKTGTNYISIKTLRPLKAGDEVIVAYGSKYTKAIREVIREENKVRMEVAKIPVWSKVACVLCKLEETRRKMRYDSKLAGFRHKLNIPCVNIAKQLNACSEATGKPK